MYELKDRKAEEVAYTMKSGADTVVSAMPAEVALELVNRIGKKSGKAIKCGEREFSASDFQEAK